MRLQEADMAGTSGGGRARSGAVLLAAVAAPLFGFVFWFRLPAASAGDRGAKRTVLVPHTIASIPGRIDAFAQAGRFLAWLPRSKECAPVVFRNLGTGRTRVAASARNHEGCDSPLGTLLLAGAHAFWTESVSGNTYESITLLTAAPGERGIRDHQVGYQEISNDGFDVLVLPLGDGRYAYFWSSPEDGTGPIVRFDGRRRKRLTGTIESVRALAASNQRFAYATANFTRDCAQDPVLSADGKRLAFASYVVRIQGLGGGPCRGGIWVADANGRHARRIAQTGHNPDWSPDGSRIAYDNGAAIVVVGADGSNPAVVIANGTEPAWSPDGRSLAFTRDSSIFVAAADGSSERLLTDGGAQPAWSPDGAQIAFAIRGATGSHGLAAIAADGTGRRQLTSSFDSRPAWSPDGQRIAYDRCSDAPKYCRAGTGETRIYAIAPDGTGSKELTENDELSAFVAPAWAPDSRGIVMAVADEYLDDGDWHLFTLTDRQLTRAPRPQTPIVIRANGRRIEARVMPNGEVEALALTRLITAALTVDDAGASIEILQPRRRVVRLPGTPAPALAAAGNTVVFHVGRFVYRLDARAGSPRLIARTAAPPIGLSVSGRRIAWGENIRGRARIEAITLP
jgi:Tol biopolymer transport system component